MLSEFLRLTDQTVLLSMTKLLNLSDYCSMHFKFTFFSKHVHLQPVPIFFQIYVCYFGLQGIQGEPGEGGLIGPPGGTVCLLFIDDTVELRLSRLFGT